MPGSFRSAQKEHLLLTKLKLVKAKINYVLVAKFWKVNNQISFYYNKFKIDQYKIKMQWIISLRSLLKIFYK